MKFFLTVLIMLHCVLGVSQEASDNVFLSALGQRFDSVNVLPRGYHVQSRKSPNEDVLYWTIKYPNRQQEMFLPRGLDVTYTFSKKRCVKIEFFGPKGYDAVMPRLFGLTSYEELSTEMPAGWEYNLQFIQENLLLSLQKEDLPDKQLIVSDVFSKTHKAAGTVLRSGEVKGYPKGLLIEVMTIDVEVPWIGELIVVDEDSCLVQVAETFMAIKNSDIVAARVTTHGPDPGTYALLTGVAILPSLVGAVIYAGEYGGAFIGLAVPMTIVGGAITMSEGGRGDSFVSYPTDHDRMEAFSKYARFPQGLPTGFQSQRHLANELSGTQKR